MGLRRVTFTETMRERTEIIDHLCAAADALLCKVNPAQVLSQGIYFDSLSCEDVAGLLFESEELYQGRTLMECRNIAESVSRYICSRDDLQMRLSQPGKIHIFELLSDVVGHLLLRQNGKVVCRYNEILQWRELVQSIGEELPVAVMYTRTDLASGKEGRTDFSWDIVAGHNNEPLNQLLRQGISDHHLHLWVSAPHFQVSWVNLMNQVTNSVYIRHLEKIDHEDWNLQQERGKSEGEQLPEEKNIYRMNALSTMHQQAALIRVYLCARLQGRLLCIDPRNVRGERQYGEAEAVYAQQQRLASQNVQEELPSGKVPEEVRRSWDYTYVQELLNNPHRLYVENSRIQSIISSFQGLDDLPYLDYAHRISSSRVLNDQPVELVYAGERWFLCSMLRDIYVTFPRLRREEHNLFYAYLMLQLRIREKMLQVDQKVGFDHFQKLQSRKSYFITDKKFVQLIMHLAVWTPLKQRPHLQELEARIAPRASAEQIYRDIADLENASQEESAEVEELKQRYYYVLHFTKEEDKCPVDTKAEFTFDCRHAQYRLKLERQAKAIMVFREQYTEVAKRVLGIDACSQEIGCRPENFAFIFRLLSQHTCGTAEKYGETRTLPTLRMTYHVGEDFLDLADGLRAIDEAVRFLNLDCGDRLGHALALCMKPREWYGMKKGEIFLQKQDYLDNVTWLYYAIHHYHLPDLEAEELFLKNQFTEYFRQIYRNHMDEEEMQAFMQAAVRRYAGKQYARNYQIHKCSFSIEDYMRSWMLRGDHPELYRSGYFWQEELLLDDWSRLKRNERFPADSSIRYIPECSYLNFCYHYNTGVRKTGGEYCTVSVDERYIRAVEAAQRALQFDIASRGLSVESNPTSNVKISTFRSYETHPMTTLFNKGLSHSDQSMRNCPQVPVSINTDDSGLFFTSLENEFAVMARALELRRDEQGKVCYYKWEIYDWLDAVRKNGNNQSFQSR